MVQYLQLALRNAKSLTQHTEQLRTLICIYNVDVMLNSRDALPWKNYLKFLKYTVYHMHHPAGTGRGCMVKIIKHSIKHHQLNNHSQHFLQATSVSVQDSVS
jgi:hypothetical protein